MVRPIEGGGDNPTLRPETDRPHLPPGWKPGEGEQGGRWETWSMFDLHSKLVDGAARYNAGEHTPDWLEHMVEFDGKLKAAINDVDVVSQNPATWDLIAQHYSQAPLPENPSTQNLNEDAVAQFIRGDSFKQIGVLFQQLK